MQSKIKHALDKKQEQNLHYIEKNLSPTAPIITAYFTGCLQLVDILQKEGNRLLVSYVLQMSQCSTDVGRLGKYSSPSKHAP